MNLQDLGSLGEIIGALAVVVSLIYVGIQIRQNTIATERANARQAASDQKVALAMCLEEKVSEIILQGIDDISSLTDVDRYRFDIAMSAWLETHEQALADSRLGLFPEGMLFAARNRASVLFDGRGGHEWWERRRSWFSPEFRSWMDQLRAEGRPEDMRGAGLQWASDDTEEAESRG